MKYIYHITILKVSVMNGVTNANEYEIARHTPIVSIQDVENVRKEFQEASEFFRIAIAGIFLLRTEEA